jgi:hypothetical protein
VKPPNEQTPARDEPLETALESAQSKAEISILKRREFLQRKQEGSITFFRYKGNQRGFIFLQVCSALLFVMCFVIWLGTSFSPLLWGILAGALALLSLFFLYLVAYWSYFARVCGIAFDQGSLYVAEPRRVSAVPWQRLNTKNAGLTERPSDGVYGTLHIRIDSKHIPLRLFNAFVWVEDFPIVLAELLEQIQKNGEQNADDDPGEQGT